VCLFAGCWLAVAGFSAPHKSTFVPELSPFFDNHSLPFAQLVRLGDLVEEGLESLLC
jgi:hypothetical protein